MGTPKTPGPVKLIAGLLASSDALLDEGAKALRQRFGPTDAVSAATAWQVTEYYAAEMGTALRRQFLSFERLIAPDELVAIKVITNELEEHWRSAGNRRLNIDPGYVAATKLVLASTKDAAHRIHLGHGIYAEVTLQFASGSYRAHLQTYPDYATADVLAFFNATRQRYLAELRALA